MKAISLWEPWATLMALDAKRIETRSWATHVRGQVAIHAAKQPFHPGDWPPDLLAWMSRVKFWGSGYHYGCVVAIAELVDCVPTEQLLLQVDERERAFGNYHPRRFGWVFKNVRRLTSPIPARGSQGFWEWDSPELLELVRC